MESSTLIWQRIIEFLATNMDTRTSSVSANLDSTPIVLGVSLNTVRERLSLRCLEVFTGMACEEAPPAVAANTTSTLDSAEKIDASHTCEKVLSSKVEAANDYDKANVDLYGGDHQQFILLKRAVLRKDYFELLKEKVLESSKPDFSYSKECNNLSEVSRPCANLFTYNSHTDDNGIEKFVQTFKYASQRRKEPYLIREYRKLNNPANTPLKCEGRASPKDYSSLQHLAEQNAMDDMKNQQTNVDGTQNEFQMEKTKVIPGKISTEFLDVEAQLPKGKLSDSASPIFAPDDLDDFRSVHESQNIANTPLKCVGVESQKDYSYLQHLTEQNAMGDMKNQRTNVDGMQNEFQMEKTKAVPGKISAEFYDVETQLPKGKLSDSASPIFAPNDLDDSRSVHESQNIANTPLKCVGVASQKDYSSLQHLTEQNAMDDMKNQQTNVDGMQNEFQMDKTKEIPGKISAEFLGVETQLPNGKLSHSASPSFAPDDLNDSRSGHDSQNLNVLHHDRLEVADSDCDDVNLLEQCSIPQPSSAQRLCIKCASNDQLLNCSGEGCLRAIHERCLGLLASVEETGIFYCPFCSYRNARMMFEKAKRKTQEARRNLFAFYDICPAIHARKRKSPSKILIESEQVNGKHNLEESCKETIECNSETGREHGRTQVTGEQEPVNDLGITGYDSLSSDLNASHETNDVCVNNSICEINKNHLQSDERTNLHSSDADDEQISLQPNKISVLNVEGGCDNSAKLKALSSKISVRLGKRNRSDKADCDDAYHGVIESKRTDGSPMRVLRKRQNQLNQCSVTKQPLSRRPKLIWKSEEEEILEEAMEKIPQNDDGNISWIKILEYCRPVVHESRTPIDLKDKWRNMQRKEVRTGG